MSTAVAKQDDRATRLQSVFDSDRFRKALAATLPRHLPAERMIRVVLSCFQTTPKILECDPQTIVLSVLRAASLGLEPDGGPLGQGYLVPYWNSKNRRRECQFIPGYRGLVKMARNSGEVADVWAEVVYDRDVFEYSLGMDPTLRHVRYDGRDNPGEITHAYAIARFRDGEKRFTVMNRRELDKIRDDHAPRDKDTDAIVGPWKDHHGEQCKKTAVRRLSKSLPLSVEVKTQIETCDDDRGTPEFIMTDLPSLSHDETPALEQSPQNPAWEQFLQDHHAAENILGTRAAYDKWGVELSPEQSEEARKLTEAKEESIRANRGGRKQKQLVETSPTNANGG